MNLSEEELVKYVALRNTPGIVHPDIDIENQISRLRWAVWRTCTSLGTTWECETFRRWMRNKSKEEVLEMIARARLEEEI